MLFSQFLATLSPELDRAIQMGGREGWHGGARICLHYAKRARHRRQWFKSRGWTCLAHKALRRMFVHAEHPQWLTTEQVATVLVTAVELSRYGMSAGGELKALHQHMPRSTHTSHRLLVHLVSGKHHGHLSAKGRHHFAVASELFSKLHTEHSGHSYILGCAARVLSYHHERLRNEEEAAQMREIADRVPIHPLHH